MDRASRFTILLHLPGRHTAEAVRDVLITVMSPLPPELRRSLTWDQGKELALHKEVAAELNARPRKTLSWVTPAGQFGW